MFSGRERYSQPLHMTNDEGWNLKPEMAADQEDPRGLMDKLLDSEGERNITRSQGSHQIIVWFYLTKLSLTLTLFTTNKPFRPFMTLL